MSVRQTPLVDKEALSTCVRFGENLHDGLALLRQAYTYAQASGADLWDFALEIDNLYATGLTVSDLRWLVAKGLARHGRETSVYGDVHRSFRCSDGFNFEDTSSLVLTPRGVELADHVMRESAMSPASTLSIDTAPGAGETGDRQNGRTATVEVEGPHAALKPIWDSQRRELWLAATMVKRFRVPAKNQETILCAFEEEAWPEHVDDPLPLTAHIDPHTRLHDAINRLNGHQTNSLLRFHGNGNGTGVSWELRSPE